MADQAAPGTEKTAVQGDAEKPESKTAEKPAFENTAASEVYKNLQIARNGDAAGRPNNHTNWQSVMDSLSKLAGNSPYDAASVSLRIVQDMPVGHPFYQKMWDMAHSSMGNVRDETMLASLYAAALRGQSPASQIPNAPGHLDSGTTPAEKTEEAEILDTYYPDEPPNKEMTDAPVDTANNPYFPLYLAFKDYIQANRQKFERMMVLETQLEEFEERTGMARVPENIKSHNWSGYLSTIMDIGYDNPAGAAAQLADLYSNPAMSKSEYESDVFGLLCDYMGQMKEAGDKQEEMKKILEKIWFSYGDDPQKKNQIKALADMCEIELESMKTKGDLKLEMETAAKELEKHLRERGFSQELIRRLFNGEDVNDLLNSDPPALKETKATKVPSLA